MRKNSKETLAFEYPLALFEVVSRVENDFEAIQFNRYPRLTVIKEALLQRGAVLARMGGSGPTMLGIFADNRESSRVCRGNFSECQLYTVKPILLPEQGIPQIRGQNRGNYRNSCHPEK